MFSKNVALFLLAKSKYERKVYTILKVAYQGTITTKKFGCTPSVVESIVHSSRIDLSGTPCICVPFIWRANKPPTFYLPNQFFGPEHRGKRYVVRVGKNP